MRRIRGTTAVTLALGTLIVASALAGAAAAPPADGSAAPRAAWLLERALGAPGVSSVAWGAPDETGVGGVRAPSVEESGEQRRSAVLPMAMSLVLPGLGEVYRGHKRGFALMAADAAAWFAVKHYADQGNEQEDAYLAYADVHWSLDDFAAAFSDPDGAGAYYFYPVTNYTDLALWVSKEDDEREYYENLGKWNQFVFGWDDYYDPRYISELGPDYTSQDLDDPRVSANREIYRAMRRDANDQFTKRDRVLYINMALRLFSVFQVAYLEGLLGGGPQDRLAIAGHPITIIAEPGGWSNSRLGVSVAY